MNRKYVQIITILLTAIFAGGNTVAQTSYNLGTLPANLEFGGTAGNGLYVAEDFNNDGFIDVLYQSGGTAGTPLAYYQNNGSGSFATPATNPFAAFTSATPTNFILNASSSVADFDGDGDLDVWCRISGNDNDIFLRNDNGTYVSATLPSGMEFTASAAGSVAVADFNGDGYVDIIYNGSAGGGITYLQNNAGASFTTPATHPFSSFSSASPAGFLLTTGRSVADFDGDGDLDIWIRVGGAGNDVYLKNDNGIYTSATLLPGMEFAGTGVGAVSVADFNGDGYPDYLYNTAAGQPLIYVQNNAGISFSTPSGNPFGTYATTGPSGFVLNTSSSVADFDGDGDIDIWVRINDPGNDLYMTNTGAAPRVITKSPANNAVNVNPNTDIVLTFSEPMFKGSGNIYIRNLATNAITETIPVSGSQVTGEGTNIITINPANTLAPNTSYYITFDRQVLRDADNIIMGELNAATKTRNPETAPAFLTFTTTTTPLAMNILSITATTKGPVAEISWHAVSNHALDYMELQKSTAGEPFSALYTTPARVGEGRYNYSDKEASGKVFYRLKLINADGGFTYSDVVSVSVTPEGEVSIYPNPAKAVLFIRSTFSAPVTILDINGKIMKRMQLTAGSNQITTQDLPAGMYMLIFPEHTQAGVFQFVKE